MPQILIKIFFLILLIENKVLRNNTCNLFYAKELNQPWSDWTVTPTLRQGMWNKILNAFTLGLCTKKMSYLKTTKENSYPHKKFRTYHKFCSGYYKSCYHGYSSSWTSCGMCSSINSTSSPRSRLPEYSVIFCPSLKRINVGYPLTYKKSKTWWKKKLPLTTNIHNVGLN